MVKIQLAAPKVGGAAIVDVAVAVVVGAVPKLVAAVADQRQHQHHHHRQHLAGVVTKLVTAVVDQHQVLAVVVAKLVTAVADQHQTVAAVVTKLETAVAGVGAVVAVQDPDAVVVNQQFGEAYLLPVVTFVQASLVSSIEV